MQTINSGHEEVGKENIQALELAIWQGGGDMILYKELLPFFSINVIPKRFALQLDENKSERVSVCQCR